MIALCSNPYRDTNLSRAEECRRILTDAGYRACICPVFTDEDWTAPDGIRVTQLRDVMAELSHVIVLGGDGTILAVVRELHGLSVPILGVNLGTKGFMTSLEPEELGRITEALCPDVPVSERMMLDVSLIRGNKTLLEDHALNDVVIHGYGECIQPTAWADGKQMFSFSGDGLVVATPTGSTGYSMSAGGPIVEPDARAILLTPICAHTLSAKPYVLSPQKKVRVLTEKLTGRRAYLAVDGYSVADLESGDLLEVRQSQHFVRMIELSGKSFYERLEKLV
ncbi:MAG: NAD(+)/NADH kinase [Oscillospiraceae bacterium]|nr:NAD(+)/NADH kinase [Oscillospiraceae bacterium]